MPRGLNKVMIIGNLGHAPELRYTAGGQAVTSLSVAVNRLGRDQAGTRVEVTEWFRVVAWERLAETCAEYLTKGARVFVEGRLQSRRHTGKDGVERTIVEVVATDLLMLDTRPPAVPAPASAQPATAASPPEATAVPPDWDDAGDEVPF